MFSKLFVSALSVALIGSVSFADNAPKTVNIGLKGAYIPIGFDDNDRTQIAVEGVFPNTCYRVGPHALKVDQAYKTISVQQQAYVYGGVCLQMFVPFTQIVDVGLLESGNYKLLDSLSGKQLGTVAVGKSKNEGPDDFLYAPITDAYIMRDPSLKKSSLVISGSFSDRCSDFEEIKVQYQDRVLVVQPMIKRITNDPCPSEKTRFLKVVELDKDILGTYLLHVRSLNGQAINKMVDLE